MAEKPAYPVQEYKYSVYLALVQHEPEIPHPLIVAVKSEVPNDE